MKHVCRSSVTSLTLLVLGLATYIWAQVITVNAQRHDNDFKHIYLGTLSIFDGESPYPPEALLLQASRRDMRDISLNPFVYLPFTGLSLAFLQPLTFATASDLWFLLNHVFLLLILWLIATANWPRHRCTAFSLLLLAMSFNHTLTRTLTAGQLNLVLLLCAASAYALLIRGRNMLSGAVLGYAAVFKLAPAAYALYFLIQHRWRSLTAMILTIFGLLGLSVAIAGWQMHVDFLSILADMRYGRSTWQHTHSDGSGATFWKDPPNQSINSLFTHLVVADNQIADSWLNLSQSAANYATWASTIFFIAAYLWAAFAGQPRRPAAISPAQFSIFDQGLFHATLLLSLLIPSLMWDHYLVAAILPVAWLTHQYWFEPRRKSLLAALAIVYGIICIPWNFFAPEWRSGPGVLLMSAKLYPCIALYLMVCYEVRRTFRPGIPLAAKPQIN